MIFSLKRHRKLIFIVLFIITQLLSIRAGKYFVFVTLIFFITLFFFLKPKFNKYILFGFLLSFLLCVRGILNGNLFVNILEDFLIFTPILSSFLLEKNLFVDLEKSLAKYFVKSLFILIPLGVLIYIYMDYNVTSFGLDRFNYNPDIKFEFFSPIIPFLFAPYLIFYYRDFNNTEKFLMIQITMLNKIFIKNYIFFL